MSVPLSGARQGRPSPLSRLAARAAARELVAFVVPGPEVARARSLDLEAAGLRLADTPRHASVLALVGELPEDLKKAAAVVYAQMPRPRAILAVGAGDVSPLPAPDVAVGPREALAEGVASLGRLFSEGAFGEEVDDFDVDAVRTQTEYVCPMHPEVVSDEPGSCPKCGMDLVPREAAGRMDHGHMDHSGHDAGGQAATEHGHEGHDGAYPEHIGHEHAGRGSMDHPEHGGHEDTDHERMARGDTSGHGQAVDEDPGAGYTCPMHLEVTRDEPGSCPICGMNLVPREEVGGEHASDSQTGMQHGGPDAEQGAPGEHGSPVATDRGEDSSGREHPDREGMEHEGHGGMDHGHMDHGAMGFMSMVEMTKDLPRGSDGLQMERIETPFGPLFGGLPAGLSLTLTLAGDTVEGTEASGLAAEDVARPAESFADSLARLDPLSPVAYRLLAVRVVEEAAGIVVDERTVLARAGALERERAASHLNWLASFAHLIGYPWLERRAAGLQLALLRAASAEEAARMRPEVTKLARRIERTPLLRRKLRGVGRLPDGSDILGPVARARGERKDARTEEAVYRNLLGFEPVVGEGDDALSRLLVRLREAERSLELVRRAGSVSVPTPGEALDEAYPDGVGSATVETPRGAATLRVALREGRVTDLDLETSSARHLRLVGAVTEGKELADALVGVASLDLSPWGVSSGVAR